MNIEEVKLKLSEILTHGLTTGLGTAEPGKFCAEAAVCYALGEPHSDSPSCVHAIDRALVIKLNDLFPGTEQERATALRPILLAHLGTKGRDRTAWAQAVTTGTIKVIVPMALYAAADACGDVNHVSSLYDAANRCETEGTKESAAAAADAAYYAYYAANAAYCAAADAPHFAEYATSAEAVVNAANAAYYTPPPPSATPPPPTAPPPTRRLLRRPTAYAPSTPSTPPTTPSTPLKEAVFNKFIEVVMAAYEG